ncbi:hypothetical protein TWF718_005402 [Orbilia javanica]|uniref:Uncharacterized protein n=1 Tax=Orbilia javanica TaxID=47235 RepID=A0AAN8MUP1_9PEZI
MVYENADAADMRQHQLRSVQERHFPAHLGASDFHQEHSTRAAVAIATETEAVPEKEFSRIEVQSTKVPKTENAAFRYGGRGGENATATTRVSSEPQLESELATRRMSRTVENATSSIPEENAPKVPQNLYKGTDASSSEDEDSDADIDDEADKISFHKIEISRLLCQRNVDRGLLLVHLKSLVEKYRVSSYPKATLLLSTFYLQGLVPASGERTEQTRKCLRMLEDYKPTEFIRSFNMVRAMAFYQSKNYSRAYKECRRLINLDKRGSKYQPSAGEPETRLSHIQSAYEIAAASSKALGDEGNMLYYRSLCAERKSRPFILIDGSFIDLPMTFELTQGFPSTSDTPITRENYIPPNQTPERNLIQRPSNNISQNSSRESLDMEKLQLDQQRKRGIFEPEEIAKNNSLKNNSIASSEVLIPEREQHSNIPAIYGRDSTTQTYSSSRLGNRTITDIERNLGINRNPNDSPPSQETFNFSVIIPPFLPVGTSIYSYTLAPGFGSQVTPFHHGDINPPTLVCDPALGLKKQVSYSWFDLIDQTGQRIPGALKLAFQSYDEIIKVVDFYIKKHRPIVASIIASKGFHYHQGQWFETGYGYEFSCLPWIHSDYKKSRSRFHFLAAIFASQSVGSVAPECAEFLRIFLGPALPEGSSRPPLTYPYLLYEGLVVSLAVGNITMASAIAKHPTPGTCLLTSKPSRRIPLLYDNHGFVLAPLPLVVILESKRDSMEESLLSLVNQSVWDSTEADCQIYDLNLFHTAAKYASLSTQPLSYLLEKHNCKRCLCKVIREDIDGNDDTAFDIVLSRALNLRSFGTLYLNFGVFAEIAKLFYKHDAAYSNSFIVRKGDLGLLDSSGFPSLFCIKKIPKSSNA